MSSLSILKHPKINSKQPITPNSIDVVVVDTQSANYINNPNGIERQQLLKAQQLRTECFQNEFGVIFDNDLDADEFDEACMHVILMDGEQAIATSRLLDSDRASLLGRFYSEGEFYLQDFLRGYPYPVLEIGRTCIHPNYRGIAVMMKLWRVISQVAMERDINAFMGCCSISVGAGDVNAWLNNLSTTKLSIKPKHRLPMSPLSFVSSDKMVVPPLLNMYLRMGASVAEQACFDPDFHCADVLVWLPFEQIKSKYQSFLR